MSKINGHLCFSDVFSRERLCLSLLLHVHFLSLYSLLYDNYWFICFKEQHLRKVDAPHKNNEFSFCSDAMKEPVSEHLKEPLFSSSLIQRTFEHLKIPSEPLE